MKRVLAFVLLAVGLYFTRAALPYPTNYLQRAQWLEGLHGLNCAGFVLNAHGEQTLATLGAFTDPHPIHDGLNGRLQIVADFDSRIAVDESRLQAGDVVSFADGGHVTIYLGHGRFVDSDYRRGTVAEFRLADKSQDNWFAGHVRALRWKS